MEANQALDVASLSAIDVHVHAEVSEAGHHSLSDDLEQAWDGAVGHPPLGGW